VKSAVQDGASLSSALAATGQISPLVSNLVAVGEESGTLEGALLKIAASYEREADRTLTVLMTVLEPLLIVLVGLIVMFIVIAMLLPIFQLGLIAQ
jgi:type II secretory pathway component PulF